MKKMFTLFAGLLMTVALFAADRRPVVTVKKEANFKIVIDGKTYFDNDMTMKLSNLGYGRHTIKVYAMDKRGIFSRERLVSTAAFRVDNDDLRITVNRLGKIEIKERKNRGRFDKNDRDWNDRGKRNRGRF